MSEQELASTWWAALDLQEVLTMHRIPLWIYRSGTSRGALFLAKDLEAVPLSRAPQLQREVEKKNGGADEVEREDLICAKVVGSGHVYAADGVGGGRSSTSKSLYIRPSDEAGTDVEVKFVQAEINKFGVDTGHGDCGNMLASVGPFAIESGIVRPTGPLTRVSVKSLNTGGRFVISVETELREKTGGLQVNYSGETEISGISGSSAPVRVTCSGISGTLGRGLLPTGRPTDKLCLPWGEDMEVTCIDFSRPMVLVSLEDMGLKGNETKVECDQNNELNHRIQEVSGLLLFIIVTRLRMPTSSSAQAVAICSQACSFSFPSFLVYVCVFSCADQKSGRKSDGDAESAQVCCTGSS